MWGEYREGNLGLGNTVKLSTRTRGGYVTEEEQVGPFVCTSEVMVPTEVRFDHGLEAEGGVKRYCFAAAAGGYSTAALVVDLADDEASPEGLK